MASIQVVDLGNNVFEVTVAAHSTTVHRVTVKPEYAANLLRAGEATNSLVERSFQFLLARESNTSILRSFDLSVIAHYFPEYAREMRT